MCIEKLTVETSPVRTVLSVPCRNTLCPYLHILSFSETLQAVPFKVTGSSSHESLSQVSSFIYLQLQHLFMTVSYRKLTTWNFRVRRMHHDSITLWSAFYWAA